MIRQFISKLKCSLLFMLLLSLPAVTEGAVGAMQQNRAAPVLNPQARLLQFYRQYPERYLRISKEAWKYVKKSKLAFHTFTLVNTAAVPYGDIRVRVSYQTPAGKIVNEQVLKISGVIGASRSLQLDQLRVKDVPDIAEIAVLSILSATPQP